MDPEQNFRTEEKVNLKKANVEFTNCFTDKFLPLWLKSGVVKVEDVCGS